MLFKINAYNIVIVPGQCTLHYTVCIFITDFSSIMCRCTRVVEMASILLFFSLCWKALIVDGYDIV